MDGSIQQNRRQILRKTATGVGALSLGGLVTGSASAQQIGTPLVIGETGAVTSTTQGRGDWDRVNFDSLFVETLTTLDDPPIVIMKPVSYNGIQPCHVRLRNVTTRGFEYQVEEWEYLDGSHISEQLSWVAIAPGVYEIETGSGTAAGIEASTVPTTNEAQNVSFTVEFDNIPVVLGQSQTKNGPNPIITRVEVASAKGFNVRLQEEEATADYHRSEEVGYIAIEAPTVGSIDSLGLNGVLTAEVEARRPGKVIRDSPNNPTRIPFFANNGNGFNRRPRVVADIQTRRGPQPCQLRRTALRRNSMDLFVEEEQSADAETNHAPEDMGFLAFGESGLLPGTVALDVRL